MLVDFCSLVKTDSHSALELAEVDGEITNNDILAAQVDAELEFLRKQLDEM